jgi:hypothetical protein
MAATTTAREAKRQEGRTRSHKCAAVKIPKGVLVCHNTAGYATNGADTASFLFAGVAYETVDNSAGAAGDKSIRVEKTGDFEFAFGAGNAAQALVGTAVYITDNQTVDLAATTTNDVLVGYISEIISATKVRVRIDNAVK